jgi:hypothetical protein
MEILAAYDLTGNQRQPASYGSATAVDPVLGYLVRSR